MTHAPKTLLDELEAIDASLLDGSVTYMQAKRGQQLAQLADAAPDLFDALNHLFNILHDYENSVRKGYIKNGLEQARKALTKAKAEGA